MSWSHRLLVFWMAAAAVHLPMPVGDGDNLRSDGAWVAGATWGACWDVDFILLGCDPPDDCDDGPVDDDPEHGSGSPLGSYLVHVQSKTPDVSGAANAMPRGPDASGWLSCQHALPGHSLRPRSRLPRNLSFAKACQNGLAVMRC